VRLAIGGLDLPPALGQRGLDGLLGWEGNPEEELRWAQPAADAAAAAAATAALLPSFPCFPAAWGLVAAMQRHVASTAMPPRLVPGPRPSR
jgi:hypothetical protein